jgi:glyoxylase-like metal-dependent hydrolase (beta-lactamase superfamily II)
MDNPVVIDCNYLFPEGAASYLLVEDAEAAFIETNTTRAAPLLLAALQQQGLRPEAVRYVIITHVHLDHAGGAGTLMQMCPRAMLLCHPRAVRHVTEPGKLIASARQVYGDDIFSELYGNIEAIAPERVMSMGDHESLTWGNRRLRFLHTRGHANHHFCIHDETHDVIYTGDAFGLCYPALQSHGRFVFPSTSPTGFDAVEALRSVERIVSCRAQRAFLTHYGPLDDIPVAATQLEEHLEFSGHLVERALQADVSDIELAAYCERELRERFAQLFARRHIGVTSQEWKLMKLDIELNAQGLAHAVKALRLSKAR